MQSDVVNIVTKKMDIHLKIYTSAKFPTNKVVSVACLKLV
jgi:hypothetical protein